VLCALFGNILVSVANLRHFNDRCHFYFRHSRGIVTTVRKNLLTVQLDFPVRELQLLDLEVFLELVPLLPHREVNRRNRSPGVEVFLEGLRQDLVDIPPDNRRSRSLGLLPRELDILDNHRDRSRELEPLRQHLVDIRQDNRRNRSLGLVVFLGLLPREVAILDNHRDRSRELEPLRQHLVDTRQDNRRNRSPGLEVFLEALRQDLVADFLEPLRLNHSLVLGDSQELVPLHRQVLEVLHRHLVDILQEDHRYRSPHRVDILQDSRQDHRKDLGASLELLLRGPVQAASPELELLLLQDLLDILQDSRQNHRKDLEASL
jgi:hypothetical protein